MLIEGDSPVIEKLNGIHGAGTAALRAGTVEPFTGYPESLKNRFGVYFRYTAPSEQLVKRIVLDEVTQIGQDLGIGLFVAGRPVPDGHPIHTTVLECLYEGEDYNLRSKIFGEHPLMDRGGLVDSAVSQAFTLRRRLDSPGLFINREWYLRFNVVLVDKGPILLAANEIPQEIIDIRGELAEEYTRVGLRPLPLDNLLHMTLTRMTKVVNPEQADEYIERMEALHQKIAEDPLILQVRALSKRNAFDMLHGI